MIIGFDIESDLIRPGVQAPAPVCTVACAYNNGRLYAPELVGGADSYGTQLDRFRGWLRDPNVLLTGANTAFDMLCYVTLASEYEGYSQAEELLAEIFAKYENNGVSDVLTRQKMLDLANGCYRGYLGENGKWVRFEYNLENVAYRHSGIRYSKVDDEWRLRYGELRNVPQQRWPHEAIDYSIKDGYATTTSHVQQAHAALAGAPSFPGYDPLYDEPAQVRSAFWLKLMSVYGIRTDQESVRAFAEQVRIEHYQLSEELSKTGLVRREYKLHRDKLVDYLRSRGKLAEITTVGDPGGPPKVSLARKKLEATGDPIAGIAAHWRDICDALEHGNARYLQAFNSLVEYGIASVEYHRNTKAAARRMLDVMIGSGRVVPRTESYDENKSQFDECVALDKDACDTSGDLMLQTYGELSSLGKTLSNDVPALFSGVRFPVHSRFEELLDTGRTSSSKPNIQNVRRLPGIRECFIPRQGHVFVDADYKMLELHTLAQVCTWVLGYSTLGEALRAGRDPHLQIGANIMGYSYDEALRRRTAGNDSELDNARDCGKVVNFGRAGGLGKDTLATYAYKSYGIRMPVLAIERGPNDKTSAEELIKLWNDTWTEMPAFFEYVHSLESFPQSGSFNVVLPYSLLLRGDTTYCSALNTFFQGLGATVAKAAGWRVARACYVDRTSPLFGCRIANFIHDQFLLEVREERARAAAKALVAEMAAAGKEILPDVPVTASVLLSRVWSKKAKPVYDANKELLPWDPSMLKKKAA